MRYDLKMKKTCNLEKYLQVKFYVLKANGSTLKHIIKKIYSFKMHINNNIINEHKTLNTTNDKGVHPSLGLHLLVQLPMDH
jgi:hypothetical protein